jgi:glycosyltransferase involved in cell wall biosynthesis
MPKVSVIIPCFNEENTIILLLSALYLQTYPRSDMEVIIADGLSTDRTRQQIEAFCRAHNDLDVRVIDNPQRSIPSGLNRAIREARGEIIVRLDAHSIPYPEYIARCVEALEAGRGDNVGGVWEIEPGGQGWIARAIAAAAAHPLGAGDARYRLGGPAQLVDTVPFGAFKRSLVDRVGYFNESLLTNEDYEFNVRVRQAGGKVWLDPGIRSRYFARSGLRALSRQYWRYGYWKARMLRQYPHTLRWRQALPPLFMLTLALSVVLSIKLWPFRWLLGLELSFYTMALWITGLRVAAKAKDWLLIFGVPLALAIMHFSWSSGFLWSILKGNHRGGK